MATFVRSLCLTLALVAIGLASAARAEGGGDPSCCPQDSVKVSPAAAKTAAADIRIEETTPADKEAIERQGTCPVSGKKLGAHGKPSKAIYGEKAIYLCCKGCVGKVKQDPDRYFGK